MGEEKKLRELKEDTTTLSTREESTMKINQNMYKKMTKIWEEIQTTVGSKGKTNLLRVKINYRSSRLNKHDGLKYLRKCKYLEDNLGKDSLVQKYNINKRIIFVIKLILETKWQ